MKTLVFFMYMFFLLLGGGQYFYASTSPGNSVKSSSPKFTKDKHAECIADDLSTTLIEDTDIDVEVELLSSDDYKENSANKFLPGKYSLQNTLYISNSRQLILNYYFTGFKISPILGSSTLPIYIALGVLRI